MRSACPCLRIVASGRRAADGLTPTANVKVALSERDRPRGRVDPQTCGQRDRVHAGRGEDPRHVRMGVGGKRRRVVLEPVPGVESVPGVEVHLRLPEGAGQVPVELARTGHGGRRQQHVAGPVGPVTRTVAACPQPEPDRVQVDVLDERDDLGRVLDRVLGERDVRDVLAEVGVQRLDDVVLLEQHVVAERDVGVDDVAHVPERRLERVRIALVRDQADGVHPLAADVLDEVAQQRGRRDDLQAVIGHREARCGPASREQQQRRGGGEPPAHSADPVRQGRRVRQRFPERARTLIVNFRR